MKKSSWTLNFDHYEADNLPTNYQHVTTILAICQTANGCQHSTVRQLSGNWQTSGNSLKALNTLLITFNYVKYNVVFELLIFNN